METGTVESIPNHRRRRGRRPLVVRYPNLCPELWRMARLASRQLPLSGCRRCTGNALLRGMSQWRSVKSSAKSAHRRWLEIINFTQKDRTENPKTTSVYAARAAGVRLQIAEVRAEWNPPDSALRTVTLDSEAG